MPEIKSNGLIIVRTWSLCLIVLLILPTFAEENQSFEWIKSEASRLIDAGGQHMAQNCFEPDLDYGGYKGLPVIQCNYKQLGLEATVNLLLITPEQFARWIIHACNKFASSKIKKCSKQTFQRIWSNSNGQVPISGVVIEPYSVLTGLETDQNVPVNFIFRDGITVKTILQLNGIRRQLSYKEMEKVTAAKISRVYKYARPIGATREMLILNGANPGISTDNDKFLKYLRRIHNESWISERHPVIDAWVRDTYK